MAYQKNIKINQNNIVEISGSLITLTGSVFGSEISGSRLQSTVVSASNLFAGGILYPTEDGDTGQILVTDGLGTLTFQNPSADDVTIRVKNHEVTTILKGTPCYITSSGTSGNIAGILRADANNPARMPAACVAFEDILADTEGIAILEGFINNVNTTGFTSGEAVYVGVGGGYTNIRPTGSALVQPLGYVEKVGVNGSGVVRGPGHHYILPNITANHIWVGGTNGVPVELNKEVFATTGSNIFVGSQTISGNLTVTGSSTLSTVSGTTAEFTAVTGNILRTNGLGVGTDYTTNGANVAAFSAEDPVITINMGVSGPVNGNIKWYLGSTHHMTVGYQGPGTEGNGIGIPNTLTDIPLQVYSANAINLSNGLGGGAAGRGLVLNFSESASFTWRGAANTDALYTDQSRMTYIGNLRLGSTTSETPNTKLDVSGNTIISGNLTVTGSITELSTRRIKTNIVSLDEQLTTISKLNPVSYTRIDDGRREYGFISEEVKEIYPEFVIGEAINYPKMVSILVSAVKELSEKVEKQSVELQLLKNKKKTTRGKK